ncbi:MAG TPA: tyrosine-type recombinase/integrase [Candidatus Onthoplasma faecigallinarum]|nr:tyrosine-type recombinase/integrase [Candidatus Onthoplasma faecigallinarum]
MSNNYYLDRNRNNMKKLNEILTTLPAFCSIFFIGIQDTTTPLTRLNYAVDLKTFFNYLVTYETGFFNRPILQITLNDIDNIDSQTIERYMAYLSYYDKDNGEIVTNGEKGKLRKLSTLRAFFKYFFNKDMLKANVASKVSSPKLHEKPIIRLEPQETAELMYSCDTLSGFSDHQKKYNEKFKVRDNAILSLFLTTGIRVSECVGLNVDDINFNLNSFRVTRKGGNQVILYFGEETAQALKDYLHFRDTLNLPKEERALFISSQGKRMMVRTMEYLVKKYAKVATPLKNITPHKLRSTYGTNLYHETKDIYIVAEVLGHKDVNTTKKHYAAISEDVRKSVAGKVKLK